MDILKRWLEVLMENVTLSEIKRTPELLKQVESVPFKLEKGKRYLFVGCGSSYNLGYIAAEMLNKNGYEADVVTGGKIVALGDFPEADVAFFISRTGESTETVLAAKALKKRGIYTISIVCAKDAELSKTCEENIELPFADEESVVMTGSFSTILYMILRGIKRYSIDGIEGFLGKSFEYVDRLELKKFSHFVFLGFDELYGLAKESALKVQEMALQWVEFHEPLDYRHGPKATLTEKTLVVMYSKDTAYEVELAKELKQMGAGVVYIGKEGDIEIPYQDGFETPVRILPVQYLAYKKAVSLGLNPDKPKNLTKSVKL